MLLRSQKIQYLIDSAIRYNESVECPFCGSREASLLDRKYLFTRLFDCNNCHLYFRHPVEKIKKNKAFYQDEYVEGDQITTSLPSMTELNLLKLEGFNHGNKNAERYAGVFSRLFPELAKIKIIDYGCSWGYISWQLLACGFDVESYEISSPRAEFGNRNLNLKILTNEDDIRGDNDIFFSSHVIEHHPAISDMIKLAKTKLKTGGYFVAISPNGSEEYRKKDPKGFHHGWGKVHPNYLNLEFYRTIFRNQPYYIGTSPFRFNSIKPMREKEQVVDDMSSEEIIVIAQF
jgi:2-polyprenyl-3-methyl-5-hydroxy-6-metoxy-1,4-benzoquinol methylase